jgi:uncharacterized membrane protein
VTRNRAIAAALACAVHLAGGVALPQEITGTITGTVTDSTFGTINNVCIAGPGDPNCAFGSTMFGQFDTVHAPREIQLGIRFAWQ